MKRFYYPLIVIAGMTVVIYLGVDIFYNTLRDTWQVDVRAITAEPAHRTADTAKRSLRDYRIIAERNLFGGLENRSSAPEVAPIDSLEPTTLKIALLGTVTGNRETSRAVIEDTDTHKQGLFKVGDRIKGATLKQILRGKVVLTVEDGDQVLAIKEPSPPNRQTGKTVRETGAEGSQIVVDARALRRSPRGALQLLSEIRMRPNMENGRKAGLLVAWIKPGSPFSRLGIARGDIVRKVNGRPVNSLDEMISLYNELGSGGSASIVLTRQGETKTVTYRLK